MSTVQRDHVVIVVRVGTASTESDVVVRSSTGEGSLGQCVGFVASASLLDDTLLLGEVGMAALALHVRVGERGGGEEEGDEGESSEAEHGRRSEDGVKAVLSTGRCGWRLRFFPVALKECVVKRVLVVDVERCRGVEELNEGRSESLGDLMMMVEQQCVEREIKGWGAMRRRVCAWVVM